MSKWHEITPDDIAYNRGTTRVDIQAELRKLVNEGAFDNDPGAKHTANSLLPQIMGCHSCASRALNLIRTKHPL